MALDVSGAIVLGPATSAVFLEINGSGVATAAGNDVYELVMAVASSKSTVEEIADQLQQLHEPRQ